MIFSRDSSAFFDAVSSPGEQADKIKAEMKNMIKLGFFIVLRERPRHECRGGIARHAKRAPSSRILRLAGYLYTDQLAGFGEVGIPALQGGEDVK